MRRSARPFLFPALGAAALTLAALLAYWPSLRGEQVWDDKIDFPETRLPLNWRALGDIWSGNLYWDYAPLRITVQWLQRLWWGNDVLGYHLTNLALHLAGGFLFWRLLGRLGVRHAWLGGALFCLHPLAVESVAWITELKNALSLPLVLLCLLAFTRYVRRRDEGRSSAGPYILALFWFLAALLAKSSVVMLPPALLLLAWWRRGRIGRADLFEALPFFLLSLVFGLLAVRFQGRAIGDAPLETLGPASRLAGAGLAVTFYAGKAFWPARLLAIYPRWSLAHPSVAQFLPWLAMAAVVVWLARSPDRAARHALLGLGWFGLNLIPVSGLAHMAYFNVSRVADHFAYLSLLAPAGLAAALISRFGDRQWSLGVPLGLGVAVILGLASRGYAANFRTQEAFWSHTARGNPDAWLAREGLAEAWLEQGRLDDAVAELQSVIRSQPHYPNAHNNLGNALFRLGRTAEAVAQYREALRLNPNLTEAHNNLGCLLLASGRPAEAAACFQDALRLDPDLAEGRHNLGLAYLALGQKAQAVAQFEIALRLQPEYAAPRVELLKLGRSAPEP